MAAPDQFAAQFDRAALDAALIQLRQDLNNMHGKEVSSYPLEVISYFRRDF
jgi:hypothetical protein